MIKMTFNNISVILWWSGYIVVVRLYCGGQVILWWSGYIHVILSTKLVFTDSLLSMQHYEKQQRLVASESE